jgi:hypothetical protein
LTRIMKALRIFETSASNCHATTPNVSQDVILRNSCILVMAISYLTEVMPQNYLFFTHCVTHGCGVRGQSHCPCTDATKYSRYSTEYYLYINSMRFLVMSHCCSFQELP